MKFTKKKELNKNRTATLANNPKIKRILDAAEKDFQNGRFKTLDEYLRERELKRIK